ncbi:low temperature requirement protein A [Acidisoma cellulosilytica]|uniref:Low temperature requirement protein A n=1 Tax=Acidisoma cellulosilyticum TaxID=2802395 RepID=A0A964E4D6_9PROT|nr:low temperature requirement protein A [Acidisoma cellulosilyticum]MCB8881580.1 low temperature requirement protein A [Acidisoma cellulosilyticum]
MLQALTKRFLAPREDLSRRRDNPAGQRVTNIELFFDLVFVFAVTQLSHSLLPEPTGTKALHTLLLFGAIWWIWIDTSWVTNWLDPDRPPVRLMLLALMLGGLVLAASIPDAFGARGLVFALCYAVMQVGRSLFMLWALYGRSRSNFRNFLRITIWMAATAVLWIAGGLAGGDLRFVLWLLALALDLGSAWAGFWVPVLGRSVTSDWDIDGAHLAERCAGFVLIALGESITVTGATFFETAWSPAVLWSFLAAFLATAAMWWIYFDTGAERGSEHIARAEDPGRIARVLYTYVHAIIVAAVILGAVGDEMTLAEASKPAGAPALLVLLGAPILFLMGNIAFKQALIGRLPLSHLVGLALMIVVALWSAGQSMLAVNLATSGVLIVVAIWESRSYRRPMSR